MDYPNVVRLTFSRKAATKIVRYKVIPVQCDQAGIVSNHVGVIMSINIVRRLWMRNSLIVFFLAVFFIVGIFTGRTAFADPSTPKPSIKSTDMSWTLEKQTRRPITATTSTTTTVPYKKPVQNIKHTPVPSTEAKVLPPGNHADWLRQAGIPEDQLGNAEWLVNHENGLWCPTRGYGQNYCPETPGPTHKAYGLAQALPGTKMASHGEDWATNPITQLRWMNDYVNARYKGWAGAVEAWKSRARICHNNPQDYCGGWY